MHFGRAFEREQYSWDSTEMSLIVSINCDFSEMAQAQAEIFMQIVVRTVIPGVRTLIPPTDSLRNMQTSVRRTWKNQAKDFSLEEKLFSQPH